MGRYTAHDDPVVDTTIESHLKRIVEVVLSRMQPTAIILRGSFGRGEGSVAHQDGKLSFLSDYEIDVVTLSPRYRSLFAEISRDLTKELCVDTGLRWVKPDYMYKRRIGPFPVGPAPVTISLYEARYGSHTLYGQDLFLTAPVIDVGQIPIASGIHLMLNRMAESVGYLSRSGEETQAEWQSIYWINKLILACVESLLLVWKQYHFLYKERGRRFSILAKERLDFMGEEGQVLVNLAEQATEFKLRPNRRLYPESLQSISSQVVSICDKVFRYVISQELDATIDGNYHGYTDRYLKYEEKKYRSFSYQRVISKFLDIYKYLRRGWVPRNLLSPNTTSQMIYSIVPPVFAGMNKPGAALPSLLSEVRRKLTKVFSLRPPAANNNEEWRYLSNLMYLLWKNFCY